MELLKGISPIAGVIVCLAMMAKIAEKVWKQGLSGKDALREVLWFAPLIAIAFNLVMLVNIGNWAFDLVNKLAVMMGMPTITK